MNEKLFCNILEVKYLKMFNRVVSYDDNSDLFPNDWFSCDDYKFKSEILLESLEKKILIVDTTKYQKSIENIILIK